MTLHFGFVLYHVRDLQAQPAVVLERLRVLADMGPGERVSIRGMLTGTDKFSRAVNLCTSASERLSGIVSNGGYSEILAFLGNNPELAASLAMAIAPFGIGDSKVLDLTFTRLCAESHDVDRAEATSLQLWALFGGLYGFSFVCSSDTELMQELSATPIQDWRSPASPNDAERLLRLQRAKHYFGRFVRGPAWGTYLGPALVAQLGGLSAVRETAPVSSVQTLPDGGAYLRLTEEPVLRASAQYATAARTLEVFLAPIMPAELRTT